jgi:hypothetical protein
VTDIRYKDGNSLEQFTQGGGNPDNFNKLLKIGEKVLVVGGSGLEIRGTAKGRKQS